MSKVRICFLGTPEFAVVALKELLKDEHFEVVGVVTQPDRPAGRKMQLTPSPVKNFAISQGLKVISPESVNKEHMLQEIKNWGAEVAVVVAFGQILSTNFLNLFPRGAVNIHGSILPRWRGAAPIQRAIEFGDVETGVTLQKIVKELDAGDIIGIRKTLIKPDQHAMQLHDELAILGADLLHVDLMDYMRGNLAPVPQDPAGVTYAKKIDKAECQIVWTEPAQKISNKIRAFVMGPGTYTVIAGKKMKIHLAKVASLEGIKTGNSAGTVLTATENRIVIQCGADSGADSGAGSDGKATALELIEVQPESRNRMKISDFQKSQSLKVGDQLGV